MPLLRALIFLPLLTTIPALAGSVDSPACKRELAAVSSVDEALARLTLVGSSEAACAAYRNHFLMAVKARAVVSACKTGADRERAIGRLDGTVEDINGAIAQSCRGS
jgi:hypothetical protein